MFRLNSLNIRLCRLTRVQPYSDETSVRTSLPLSSTIDSSHCTPETSPVQEQFIQNMHKYFQSFADAKGIMHVLASTQPDNIDIYVDNNDYLHLSFDPRLLTTSIRQQAPAAIDLKKKRNSFRTSSNLRKKQGSDNMMSGMFLQENSLQNQVSDTLAKTIVQKEGVYLTQSGYVANFSLLQAIVIPSVTHVYIDTAAHESLWQGASRGIIHKIKHNSLKDLEENLRRYGSGVIVVDALYSSKGSLADLVELCNLKEKYRCMLVVDESHSIGLYGPHGRGLAALANVTDRIDFITASLAKAYCVRAGFIAGRAQEVLYVREKSSAGVFSSALMNWDLQRLQRVIQIVCDADRERERLLSISKTIRCAAVAMEFDVEQPTLPSPILCLMGGPSQFTKKLQTSFDSAGISAAIFIAPATPSEKSILRLTLHAGLSDQDVSRIISTLEVIARNHRSELPHTFKASVFK